MFHLVLGNSPVCSTKSRWWDLLEDSGGRWHRHRVDTGRWGLMNTWTLSVRQSTGNRNEYGKGEGRELQPCTWIRG